MAERNGHLEVLQWARANGCPVPAVGTRQRMPVEPDYQELVLLND